LAACQPPAAILCEESARCSVRRVPPGEPLDAAVGVDDLDRPARDRALEAAINALDRITRF
jgi:hypothetical protein